MYKRILILILYTGLLAIKGNAQWPRFSLATDLTGQTSFTNNQRYWAVGHTTNLLFHLSKKNGIYVWFCYFSDGKFNNNLTATAKQAGTLPQQVNYVNSARLRYKEFSVGWRHYFKGAPDAEKKWNLYGFAGLGLMLGRVNNTHSIGIDTAQYSVPVLSGKANFKRLTADLGLGVEFPIGNDFFLYGEGKVFIPTTDYPSPYLFVNDRAPFTDLASVGLRILF